MFHAEFPIKWLVYTSHCALYGSDHPRNPAQLVSDPAQHVSGPPSVSNCPARSSLLPSLLVLGVVSCFRRPRYCRLSWRRSRQSSGGEQPPGSAMHAQSGETMRPRWRPRMPGGLEEYVVRALRTPGLCVVAGVAALGARSEAVGNQYSLSMIAFW